MNDFFRLIRAMALPGGSGANAGWKGYTEAHGKRYTPVCRWQEWRELKDYIERFRAK